jgi:hypothetical protein
MRTISKCTIPLLSGLLALGLGLTIAAPKASSQQSGWVTLFDGNNLDNWNQVGDSNWHLVDSAVVADKKGKDAGYLVSKKSYKNFIVRVEFWPSGCQ